MLKKRLGIEAIERNWFYIFGNIEDYFKIPSSLTIPEGCERIGEIAFSECEKLREVTFPESVEWIGYASFSDCVGLKKVVIPESVDWITDDAFSDCYNAVVILKKWRSEFSGIGWHAFKGCKDVKEEIRS